MHGGFKALGTAGVPTRRLPRHAAPAAGPRRRHLPLLPLSRRVMQLLQPPSPNRHRTAAMAVTETCLRHHQLHSRPAAGPAVEPRVSVWVHSLLTDHRSLEPLAQSYIDEAAAATGQPWTAVMLDSRCHGESKCVALAPPHDVDSMAQDTLRTLAAGLRERRCALWQGGLVCGGPTRAPEQCKALPPPDS